MLLVVFLLFPLGVFGRSLNSTHPLYRRGEPGPIPLPLAADDNLWEKHYCKGSKLFDAMFRDDSEAGQLFDPPQASAKSDWTEFPKSFNEWSYYPHPTESYAGLEWANFDHFWGVGNALRGLEVSDKAVSQGGLNGLVYVTHGQPQLTDQHGEYIPLEVQYYNNGGKEYRATGAKFAYALNTADGVIIAQNIKSPQKAGKELQDPVPDSMMPKLSRSSDIAWGLWTLAAAGSMERLKNVHFFFSISITNKPTLVTIVRALEDTQSAFAPWPGKLFFTMTEQGKALLGTPNSVGLAYFLIQHKEVLGNMYVYAIRVFQCDNMDRSACMLLAVKPVGS